MGSADRSQRPLTAWTPQDARTGPPATGKEGSHPKKENNATKHSSIER